MAPPRRPPEIGSLRWAAEQLKLTRQRIAVFIQSGRLPATWDNTKGAWRIDPVDLALFAEFPRLTPHEAKLAREKAAK